MTTKRLSRDERRHIKVTLNGHGGFERQIVAADSLDGWVEVMDRTAQYQTGGRAIVVGGNVVSRRLYGDVRITYRGIPLLRAAAGGKAAPSPKLVYCMTRSRFSHNIRIGWQAPDNDEWIPIVLDTGVRL